MLCKSNDRALLWENILFSGWPLCIFQYISLVVRFNCQIFLFGRKFHVQRYQAINQYTPQAKAQMYLRRLVSTQHSRCHSSQVVRLYTEDSSFSRITKRQWELITKYESELLDWNKKVNLISRKDAAVPGKIMSGHILPCLSISILRSFLPGETILDAGWVWATVYYSRHQINCASHTYFLYKHNLKIGLGMDFQEYLWQLYTLRAIFF